MDVPFTSRKVGLDIPITFGLYVTVFVIPFIPDLNEFTIFGSILTAVRRNVTLSEKRVKFSNDRAKRQAALFLKSIC